MKPNWFIGFPVRAPIAMPEAPKRVRLFAPEDRHLTAAFLGTVEAERAWDAWARVRTVGLEPLDIELTHFRLLGGRRPTALAAAVGDGFEAAARAMTRVQAPLVEAGCLKADRRPPLPHATLARIQRKATDAERAAAVRWAEQWPLGIRARLDEIALFTWAKDRTLQLFEIVAREPLAQ